MDESAAIHMEETRETERYQCTITQGGKQSTIDMRAEGIQLSVGAVKDPSPLSIGGRSH